MKTLMYDTGTPIAWSISRYICVNFRPRQSTDKNYINIQYGNECGASVRRKKKKRS